MAEDKEEGKLPPQLENAVNEQKSLSYSSGPSGLSGTKSLEKEIDAYEEVKNIDKKIAEMEEEEKKQRQYLLSLTSNDMIETQAKYIEEKEKERSEEEKAKEAALARIAAENDKIYKSFNDTHKDHLKRKSADAENLKDFVEAVKTGTVSDDLINRLTKTDKQKKEEREHNKKLGASFKTAEVEHEYYTREIKKIDSKLKTLPQDHKERPILEQRRNNYIKRKDVASGIIQQGHKEIDKCFEQINSINEGEKVVKKEEHKAILKEKKKDVFANTLAAVGKETFVKLAQNKGDGTAESLMNFMADTETLQEAFLDRTAEAVKEDPNMANKLKERLGEQQKNDTPSSGRLHPPSTPNIKKPTTNKGRGDDGHGK